MPDQGVLSDGSGGILWAVVSFTPPMLDSTGRPTGPLDDWVVEPKADGWRAQVAIDADGYSVWTRTRPGHHVEGAGGSGARRARRGLRLLRRTRRPGAGLPTDFHPLAGLLSARRRHQRLTFVAFDVLRLNGRSLLGDDLASRRDILDCLVRLSDGALTAVRVFPGPELHDVLAGCEHLNMEGVVVKRRTSLYRPGSRTAALAEGEVPGLAKRSRQASHHEVAVTPGLGSRRFLRASDRACLTDPSPSGILRAPLNRDRGPSGSGQVLCARRSPSPSRWAGRFRLAGRRLV